MSTSEQKWTSLPPIDRPRCYHTAVELEGKIYVCGGIRDSSMGRIRDSSVGPQASVEVFDPETKEWNGTTSMINYRFGHAAVQFGESIYVIGGYNLREGLSCGEVFDSRAKQWLSITPMKTKRDGCAAADINGKMYVVGGRASSTITTSSGEVFDPTTKEWTDIPPMTTQRVYPAAVQMGGRMYVVGGYDGKNHLSSGEVFDPTTNQWSPINNMKTKRIRHAAVQINGNIYVVGGKDENDNVLSSVEIFYPSTNQWAFMTPMNIQRYGCAAVGMKEKILVIGGVGISKNLLSSVESIYIQCELPKFYKKLFDSNDTNLLYKIEDLVNLVEDIHGLKLLYTLINRSHHLGYIDNEDRRGFFARSIEKVSKTTTCRESVAMFKQLLEKALHDGAIDDYTCKCFDREAEVTHTSNAPFVKNIWSQINMLKVRMDRVEDRMDRLEAHVGRNDANIEKLEQVSSDVVLCLRKLQKGIKHQKKVDAVVAMMSAILNAVSFGAAGSAAQGVIGLAVNSIVDFGDVSHIQDVVESFNDAAVKDAFEAGLQAAEHYGDEAVYKAAENGEDILGSPLYDQLFGAAREGNPLFAIAVTANIVSNVRTTGNTPTHQAHEPQPLEAASLPKALTDATTEEVCGWLSKHGVLKVSLDVLREEEIDGLFLFEESIDEVKDILKELGIKTGMNFRIRKAIQQAKEKGFLE